jgi:uncharacterized lipoprotein YddW (UPF0748 family)
MGRNYFKLLVFIGVLGLSHLLMACEKDEFQHHDDYDPGHDEDTVAIEGKPRYLWIDATANFERFSSQDSIDHYLEKAKQTGFTSIVVDVRPVVGDVLYESSIVEELTSWQGFTRETNWDYLETFIEKGHERDLEVFVGMNVFTGGHNYYDRGVVYRQSVMGERTTLLNRPEGMVDIKAVDEKYGAFFNPANQEVREYCLSLIEEVVRNYDLDGIILDRVRFDGLNSDFTEYSRKEFESYLGETVDNYPGDIFTWTTQDGESVRDYGDLYPQWLEWRAKVIYDFFDQARQTVKNIKPELSFGTYTGAWYPTYYEVGANWASKDYDPTTDNYTNWMFTNNYKDYGYAGLLDVYMTGVYYPTLYGSGWYTVEGGLAHAQRLVKDDVPVTSGLYVQVYDDTPEDMREAVTLSLDQSSGLMVFDIVHLIQYDYWEQVRQGIDDALEKENQ